MQMRKNDESHFGKKRLGPTKDKQLRCKEWIESIDEEKEPVDYSSLPTEHESISSNLEAIAHSQDEGQSKSSDVDVSFQ